MKNKLKIFFLILFCVTTVFAKPKPIIEYLDKNYIVVMKDFGFPNSIFPVRGQTASQDDVVFMYEFSYMYFYNNKMYRVFYSSEYPHEIFNGIKIGAKKGALTAVFGNKYTLENEGLLWHFKEHLVLAKMDEQNRLKSLWLIKEVDKQ